MTDPLVIRPVEDRDEAAISALLVQWGPELGWADLPGPAREAPPGSGIAWRVRGYEGWAEPDWTALRDVPAWAFLAAQTDASPEILGFARGKPVDVTDKLLMAIPDGGTLFEVTELYVVPARRRQGIGAQLLTRLLEAAAAEGYERSTLVSATTRSDELIRFYRRHGFEPWWIEFFRNVEPRPGSGVD